MLAEMCRNVWCSWLVDNSLKIEIPLVNLWSRDIFSRVSVEKKWEIRGFHCAIFQYVLGIYVHFTLFYNWKIVLVEIVLVEIVHDFTHIYISLHHAFCVFHKNIHIALFSWVRVAQKFRSAWFALTRHLFFSWFEICEH